MVSPILRTMPQFHMDHICMLSREYSVTDLALNLKHFVHLEMHRFDTSAQITPLAEWNSTDCAPEVLLLSVHSLTVNIKAMPTFEFLTTFTAAYIIANLQGDTSPWFLYSVDIKTKIPPAGGPLL